MDAKNGRKREQVETLKENHKNNNNNKKRQQVFPYGNYKSYYNYRIAEGVDEDPRLKVFKKEWFQGKDCLDIGCNSGIITIQIALKFNCRSILGIDIDSDRVEDANWNLRKTDRLKSARNKPSKVSKLKDNSHTDHSENSATVSSNVNTKEISKEPSSLKQIDLVNIVSFERENFVHCRHPPGKHYDTILCLSVSKWIHLNWGDDGLITLFAETWKLLRPGGIFVLEPQPWKSYESNRNASEITAANYRNIKFRPEEFQEILLDKIGFRTVEAITSDLTGSTTGFNRPILIFQK
ncbi:putative RNA methyltransferase bin3, bin3-type S-adenosyl-L-methionine binding protein [Medicago truncatula]|uniref:RNA methyltransferase n=1 Tax=Medicago truncatula TaxID=3880 RepID=G7L862_MEDTR|nr:probable RNA methyltransferase At5g51130 [Medicago truncatula]AET05230.1 RNA methyltransferase plant, putative [Medicago truncatula]RHN43654.1 putative RNA methyltransferase bin3, bin3-type S-adenosyl-L-methionine binding protein [Medicago truncatula]